MIDPIYQKAILLAIGLSVFAVVISIMTLFNLYQFEMALVVKERTSNFGLPYLEPINLSELMQNEK